MKIKLQSNSKLQVVKAVMHMLDIGLKEAKDLVDEREVKKNNEVYVIIDSEKTEEQIKEIAKECEVTYIPLSDADFCDQNCNQVEQKLQKAKPQEVTEDDLGVSIHSIDEISIGWQCKMLFTHEHAARVMAGLHDATFNVTETLVTHDGDKATMLVITKTFPTGTRKKDLEKFEKLIRIFIQTVCAVVSLEDALEGAKERAIEAFNELRDYE